MGQCYGQLSLEERVEIYRLHAGGRSQNEIASALDRAPSTISRELRRKSQPSRVWTGGYKPVRAQQLAERRRRWDSRYKLARQPDLRNCGGKSLAMGHSPAEVEGRHVPGHWEADFMLFARYGQGLLVLHERQTRFSVVLHPVDRKAVLTARTIARQLGKLPQAMRKTISFDNGTKFAEHHR